METLFDTFYGDQYNEVFSSCTKGSISIPVLMNFLSVTGAIPPLAKVKLHILSIIYVSSMSHFFPYE
uniref:Uncharacterized protein n=1 Tax=Romanomermis culicivorax TaxID=13658 RepID=A0A915KYH9_ROMCU